jgi:hypothetical protein
MTGYPEYFTVEYRDGQRVVILNPDPAPPDPVLETPTKSGLVLTLATD